MANTLGILITAKLDSKSIENIQKQVNDLQIDLSKKPIELKIQIDDKMLNTLTKLNDETKKLRESGVEIDKENQKITKSFKDQEGAITNLMAKMTSKGKLDIQLTKDMTKTIEQQTAALEKQATIVNSNMSKPVNYIPTKAENPRTYGVVPQLNDFTPTKSTSFANAEGEITKITDEFRYMDDTVSQVAKVIQKDGEVIAQVFTEDDEKVQKLNTSLRNFKINAESILNGAIKGTVDPQAIEQLQVLQDRLNNLSMNNNIGNEMSVLNTDIKNTIKNVNELNKAYALEEKQLQEIQNTSQRVENFQRDTQNKINVLKQGNLKSFVNTEELNSLEKSLYQLDPASKTLSKDITNIQLGLKELNSQAQISSANSLKLGKAFEEAFIKAPVWLGTMGAIFETLNLLKEGTIDVEVAMKNLQTVLPQLSSDQGQYAQASKDIIGIMQKWGVSLDDVSTSARAFGRMYKDLNEVIQLTNNATLLNVVDNVELENAVKGNEAALATYGKTFKSVNEVLAFSAKLMDSITALSHNTLASGTDLVDILTQSSAAAKGAKVDIDQLLSLGAASVGATGMQGQGGNIGRMLRTVFSDLSVPTKKVEESIKAVGVNMRDTNGHLRDAYDIILDLSKATANEALSQEDLNKAMENAASGKFQYNKFAALVGSYDKIVKDTAISLNSQGKTAEMAAQQMDTVSRKVEQLKGTFVGLFSDIGGGGLNSALKDIIDGVNDFVLGLSQINPSTMKTIEVISGLAVGLKALVSIYNEVNSVSNTLVKMFSDITAGATKQVSSINTEQVEIEKLNITKTKEVETSDGEAVANNNLTASRDRNITAINEETVATERLNTAKQLSVTASEEATGASVASTEAMIASAGTATTMASTMGEAAAGEGLLAAEGAGVAGILGGPAGWITLIAMVGIPVLINWIDKIGEASKAQQNYIQSIQETTVKDQQKISQEQQVIEFLDKMSSEHDQLTQKLSTLKEGVSAHVV